MNSTGDCFPGDQVKCPCVPWRPILVVGDQFGRSGRQTHAEAAPRAASRHWRWSLGYPGTAEADAGEAAGLGQDTLGLGLFLGVHNVQFAEIGPGAGTGKRGVIAYVSCKS